MNNIYNRLQFTLLGRFPDRLTIRVLHIAYQPALCPSKEKRARVQKLRG